MNIQFGKETEDYWLHPISKENGPGIQIDLTGDEVAIAISSYLVAHEIYVTGPTITVNGNLCEEGEIYVDPLGSVISEGVRWTGKGKKE